MAPQADRVAPSTGTGGRDVFARTALDHATEAILTVDSAGHIEGANRAAQRMFGYADVEIRGQRVDVLIPRPEQRRRGDRVVEAPDPGGHDIAAEWESLGLRKDGSRFPMEATVAPFEVNGRTHSMWFVRDVTARVQLETQLRQSQKMETLGQLAGGVAHDVNNLLTVINGWCEELGDVPREAVTQIAEAAAQAARLTGQLLTFSRKAVVAPTVIDLNRVVSDVNRMLRRVLGEDLVLEEDLVSTPVPVRADPGQLSQVLVNLALNARDAMPRGGRVRIATRIVELDQAGAGTRRVAAGRYVQLTVSDTGTGIAPDVLPRVFEPFFTTKLSGRGTGLGLATVYGIVRQAEGAVWVESVQAHGTTFTVILPEMVEVGRSDATTAVAAQDRGSETVLVVEDDPQVRRIIVNMLQSRGYRVLASADERQAVAAAEAEPHIDVLVSDVVLRERSGPEVAERLRSTHPSLGVLFVSGYTADAIAGRGVTGESASFLQKPFSGHQLGRRVREVLDERRRSLGATYVAPPRTPAPALVPDPSPEPCPPI